MINKKVVFENCARANADHCENELLATVDNAKNWYEEFDILPNCSYAMNGVAIGNFRTKGGVRRVITASPSHTLIVGGTGSGKTECFFAPQLDLFARSSNNPSMFVMDIKGSLYREKAQLLRDNGYEVITLNFKEPLYSKRYNPLTKIFVDYRLAKDAEQRLVRSKPIEREFNGCVYDSYEAWRDAIILYYYSKMDDCQTLARNIAEIISPVNVESAKDIFWDYGTQSMIFGTLWGMLEDSDRPERKMTKESYTLDTLIDISQTTGDDCETIIKWITERDKNSQTAALLRYYDSRAKVTRDSFVSCLNNKLNKFANLPVSVITAALDVDIDDIVAKLKERKVAIFCMTDETKTITYALCLMFINQLLTTLQQTAESGEREPSDFHFFLDEFANMPSLPNVENWISTLRSSKVWLHMGIQSYEQLDKVYGSSVRTIIIDNCDTMVFFGCNNSKTVQAFGDSLGKCATSSIGYNVFNDGSISANISASDKPLVRLSDLTSMKLGEAYVKCFRKPTLMTKLEPNFSSEDMRHDNVKPERVMSDLTRLEDNFYDISAFTYRYYSSYSDFDFDTRPSRKTNDKLVRSILRTLTPDEKQYCKHCFRGCSKVEDVKKCWKNDSRIKIYANGLMDAGLVSGRIRGYELAISQSEYEMLKSLLDSE